MMETLMTTSTRISWAGRRPRRFETDDVCVRIQY